MRAALVGWVLVASVARAELPDAHVLAGAKAFRAGEWSEALVEFRVALKLGAGPLVHWYEGATLVRANRFDDALAAFQLALELAPGEGDALLQYHRALACYETRQWACVQLVTAELRRNAGPRIQQQVERLATEASAVLALPPPREAIDACFTRARAADGAALKRAWLAEAARLARLRSDRWRFEEAEVASRAEVETAR